MFFVKIQQPLYLQLFYQWCCVQSEGSLLPRFLNNDTLGLDVGEMGVRVKCITDSDNVRLISYGVLDDGFRRGPCVCGDDGSKQVIGFLWAWGCPTQWTEEVVVNDDTVEIGLRVFT